MYSPEIFKVENQREAFEFMESYPFAMVISIDGVSPIFSQLPLTPVMENGDIYIYGHLAQANSLSKFLLSGQVRFVFQGPNTYITPKWYSSDDVPTWNYISLLASGHVHLLEKNDELVNCLKILSRHAESKWKSGWEFNIPEDLGPSVLPKAILGFKVKINSIEFKKKLSQNRSEADRTGVISGLENRRDENSRLIRDEMLKTSNKAGGASVFPKTLNTERLVLRAIVQSDLQSIFEYCSDPRVSRFTTWSVHQTLADSQKLVDYAQSNYFRGLVEPMAICRMENPAKLIGTVGWFWKSKINKTIEIAYAISESHRGQGLVVEAARAIINEAINTNEIQRIVSRCVVENTASARVMQKIGMTIECVQRQSEFIKEKWCDMAHYSILKGEWNK